jgi:hypothetical protein
MKNGKCKPSWKSIGEFLDIPSSSLRAGFSRFLNISSVHQLPALMDLDLSEEGETVFPEEYQDINPMSVLKILEDGEITLSDLADKLDRGISVVSSALSAMIMDGITIMIEKERVRKPKYTPADPLPTLYDQISNTLSWADFSDPHFGSKYAQLSALLKFILVAYHEHGIKNFLVPGDIHAGSGVYRGQENELYAIGGDDQVDAAVNTLPELDGARFYLLGGNHDYSFARRAGVNVVKRLCDQREDLIYAGFDQAEIPLLEDKKGNVIASIILWHPSGGVPYALSYRGQKFAAQVSQQELLSVVLEKKPSPVVRFISWGHLHVSNFHPHGPMWVYGPGCFEGTNGYLKAKGLKPIIQGVMNWVDITPSGLIGAHTFRRLQFYEQEDDFRCGHIPMLKRKAEKLEPIFKLQNE